MPWINTNAHYHIVLFWCRFRALCRLPPEAQSFAMQFGSAPKRCFVRSPLASTRFFPWCIFSIPLVPFIVNQLRLWVDRTIANDFEPQCDFRLVRKQMEHIPCLWVKLMHMKFTLHCNTHTVTHIHLLCARMKRIIKFFIILFVLSMQTKR